jgi:hypothetical protein
VDLTLRETDIGDLFVIPPEVKSQFVEIDNLNFAYEHGPLVIYCSGQGIEVVERDSKYIFRK